MPVTEPRRPKQHIKPRQAQKIGNSVSRSRHHHPQVARYLDLTPMRHSTATSQQQRTHSSSVHARRPTIIVLFHEARLRPEGQETTQHDWDDTDEAIFAGWWFSGGGSARARAAGSPPPPPLPCRVRTGKEDYMSALRRPGGKPDGMGWFGLLFTGAENIGGEKGAVRR